MSRSYKKHGIKKLGDPSFKKIFNRIIRHRKELDYPSGGRYKRERGCCSWEICDVMAGYFNNQHCNEDRAYWYYMK